MNAKFIEKPISGQFPEKHFGNITTDSLWVKFEDKDAQEWVGSFEQSWVKQATFIIPLHKHGKAFLVVGGKTFLIDVNSREQLSKTEISDTKTAIVDADEENIYYSDGVILKFMDNKGTDFILFDKYYLDDIKLTEIKDNKLFATYWNYQNGDKLFHFEIDLVTKEVNDSYH